MNRWLRRRKISQAKQGGALGPKGKESGCGSLSYATSNEQSILGVKTAPKASISIHYTEPGKPDMLLTTFAEGRGLTQCIAGKGSDIKQMPWVTPRIRGNF